MINKGYSSKIYKNIENWRTVNIIMNKGDLYSIHVPVLNMTKMITFDMCLQMMFSAVLPKLERDDVENRLNQIEHVAMTKLNALNTQELQKVNNLFDHH